MSGALSRRGFTVVAASIFVFLSGDALSSDDGSTSPSYANQPDLSEIMPVGYPGEPPRFAGWFQPWAVGLMVGVPAALLLLYRRRDISQYFRGRNWKSRVEGDS